MRVLWFNVAAFRITTALCTARGLLKFDRFEPEGLADPRTDLRQLAAGSRLRFWRDCTFMKWRAPIFNAPASCSRRLGQLELRAYTRQTCTASLRGQHC